MSLRSYTDKKQVGFAMQDNLRLLTEPSYGYTTLNPVYETDPGRSWRFSTSADFAPSPASGSGQAYVNISLTCPGEQRWFSRVATSETDNMPNGAQGDKFEETFSGNVNMLSLFMDIHVGFAPHPYSDPPRSRIAILMNQIGAYHQLAYGGPSFNPDRPRVFNNESQFENYQIRGQSWGITNYDDLLELCKSNTDATGIGCSYIRIINLGPNVIHVNGAWIFHHGIIDRRF